MQNSTQRTFLTRVAMALLLSMMSMMVTAQTLVVVDKNGKKVAYDVSKIDSVTFQNATPGFTLHEQEATSLSTISMMYRTSLATASTSLPISTLFMWKARGRTLNSKYARA